MKIGIASTNPVKVSAVKEVVLLYPSLRESNVISVSVPSGISEQPSSIDETMKGAMTRARGAFADHDLGIGIESGFIAIPHTREGVMNVTVCVIYDGVDCHVGLSSAFECPPEVVRLVRENGLDLNQAFKAAGLTKDPKLGSAQGAISLLTNGRVDRKEYTKQAITMALISLENRHLYKAS